MKKFLLFAFLISAFFSQAQVSLVKDIGNFAYQGIDPNQLIAYNGNLLFSAGPDQNNFSLWISDGTETGTISIKDLGNPFEKPGDFFYSNALDLIFFKSYPTNPGGSRIWSTDGTTSGTVKLSNNLAFITNFEEFNSEVYFGATYNSSNQILYKSDGTVSGTVAVNNSNISLPVQDFKPHHYNDKLYFRAFEGVGIELYVSDGTLAGTLLLKDINPGSPSNSSNPNNFITFNDKLYFSAETNSNGRELWVSDGTTSGTLLVGDLNTGTDSSNPSNFIVFDNELYFKADNGTTGIELFKMDTSENISLVLDINPGPTGSNPSNLTIYNDRLYYSADNGSNGFEVWVTYNGAIIDRALNTFMLKDINTSPSSPDSNPSYFTEYLGELFFVADDGVNGRELWKTDGTDVGTVLVNNINPSGDSNPQGLTVANNILFFSANDGTTGIELWKYVDPSLSVNNLELEYSISLYPNPTTNSFTIKTNQNIKNVIIYDIQGKEIKSLDGNLETYRIDEIVSGLYFVNIKTERGVLTKKIIKE